MKRKKRNEELKPDEGKKAVEKRKMEIAAVKDEEEKEKRRVEAKRRKEKRRKEKDGDGRFAFTCSFCMFRTFEEKDMEAHLASAAHQEMLEYIQKQTKFDKVIMEFLHESMASKFKKACLRKAQTSKPEAENIAETDMLEGVSSDEHLMKIETVHCSACSVYVRASYNTVQQHLNSSDHAKSKHAYKEQMKRESVLIATSLFNNPLVKGNYEKFAKGENPFEIPEIPETAEEDTEYADEEDGEDAAEAAK